LVWLVFQWIFSADQRLVVIGIFYQNKTKNKKKKLTDIGFIGFSGLVPGFTGGSFSKDLDRLMLR
jgi:hypothetical protein